MSAGAFASSKYEAGDGTIFRIRVQPETLALTLAGTTNTAPAGTVTGKITARVGGGNREYGIKARAVTVKWTGVAPDGYKADEILRVPVLTPALYNGVSPGTTGSYLGSAIEVVGKLPERVR